MAKKGLFTLVQQRTERQSEGREARSHMATARHSLTCKSPQCRTDNAWGYLLRAEKKTQMSFETGTTRKNPLYMAGITLGGKFGLLWAVFILGEEMY